MPQTDENSKPDDDTTLTFFKPFKKNLPTYSLQRKALLANKSDSEPETNAPSNSPNLQAQIELLNKRNLANVTKHLNEKAEWTKARDSLLEERNNLLAEVEELKSKIPIESSPWKKENDVLIKQRNTLVKQRDDLRQQHFLLERTLDERNEEIRTLKESLQISMAKNVQLEQNLVKNAQVVANMQRELKVVTDQRTKLITTHEKALERVTSRNDLLTIDLQLARQRLEAEYETKRRLTLEKQQLTTEKQQWTTIAQRWTIERQQLIQTKNEAMKEKQKIAARLEVYENDDCSIISFKRPRIDNPTHLPSPKKSQTSQDCSICMDQPGNMAMIPCGHVCVCKSCTKAVRQDNSQCPICRVRISGVLRVYMS